MNDDTDVEGLTPFTPEAILEALERGRADIAAGRVHELEDVLKDLENDLAELEAVNRAADTAAAGG